MKYNVSNTLHLLTIIASFSLIADIIQHIPSISIQKKPSTERAENAKFVLANLAQMIGQIGTIVEEPRNADNVGSAVTNIVNNIVKITMHAVQNKQIEIEDAELVMQTLHDVCKDLDESIIHLINVKKALMYA